MNAEWLIVMGDESRVIIVDWMMTGYGWWVMSYNWWVMSNMLRVIGDILLMMVYGG